MTWEPPTRPSWMAAVNNALVDPVTVEARRPITSFALAGAVAFRLGLRTDEVRAAVGEATLEALDVLTEALEREADLTLTGRWLAHRLLSRLLTAQVHIARLPTAEPTGAASVQRPVFVLRWGGRPPPPGHDHRSEPTRLLQPWEAVWPVPPVTLNRRVWPALASVATIVPTVVPFAVFSARLKV